MGKSRYGMRVGSDNVGSYLTGGKHAYEYLDWIALVDPSYLAWAIRTLDAPLSAACNTAFKKQQGKSASSWSGPTKAQGAASAAGARLVADIERIWKD